MAIHNVKRTNNAFSFSRKIPQTPAILLISDSLPSTIIIMMAIEVLCHSILLPMQVKAKLWRLLFHKDQVFYLLQDGYQPEKHKGLQNAFCCTSQNPTSVLLQTLKQKNQESLWRLLCHKDQIF